MKMAACLLALLATGPATAQVFDVHVHLWHGERSLREYQDGVRGLGEVGFGGMWFGGPNQALAGDPAAIRTSNDANMALANRHRDMLPVATVHPYDGAAAIEEVGRVARIGYKVLKLHAHTQKFDPADSRVLAVVRRAGEVGLTVLMDNAGVTPGEHEKLLNVALAAPKTKFIFAHIGGMGFRFWNILQAAKTAPGLFDNNIWFDVSATTVMVAGSPIQDELVWTMRNVGTDRLLIGSDHPQYSLRQTLAALDRLPLTPDEKAAIRYDNARKLLGLAQP
jgi:uncharacterized protein